MTPVFLNPPSSPFANLVEQKDQDQQDKTFINSQYNYEASSSLSSPANYFFNSSSTQDQTSDVIGSQQRDDHKAVIDVFSSTSTSQNLSTCQRDQDNIGDQGQHNQSNNNKKMNNGSAKYWMSSKMRLMQKMSNAESSATIPNHKLDEQVGLHSSPRQEYNFSGEAMFKFSPGNNSTTTDTAVRVCSDCNTTTTPLWRSGPRGPKSLCNACGIRQRKARRAMAEAAAAAAARGLAAAPVSGTTGANYTPYIKSTTASTNYYKTQYHIHKEKKSRGNQNISHYKNKLKLVKSERNDNNITNNKLCLRKFSFGLNNDKCCSAFSGVFPKDVAEAAVLLMELSCGFLQS